MASRLAMFASVCCVIIVTFRMQLVNRELFEDPGLALACKKHAVVQNQGWFQVAIKPMWFTWTTWTRHPLRYLLAGSTRRKHTMSNNAEAQSVPTGERLVALRKLMAAKDHNVDA